MKYRELLNLYKNGQLDEDTKKQVEEDIERQDAISDYLFDSEKETDFSAELTEPDGENKETLQLIRNAIQRAFIKMGLGVGCAILLIICLWVFVMPGLVSKFYYDPTEIVGFDPENENLTTTRGELDISVYSELFLPAAPRQSFNAEPQGWGKYRINIPQTTSFTGNFTSVGGFLNRGEMTLYNSDILKPPAGNAFIVPEGADFTGGLIDANTGEQMGPAGTKDEAYGWLENLKEDEWYTAYVSLSEIMDFDSFYSWYTENGEPVSAGTWCAVYTDGEFDEMLANNIGFSIRSVIQSKNWDKEKYPKLCAMNSDEIFETYNAQTAALHFTSMLKYLRDNPEITKLMPDSKNLSESLYDSMIESVEKDGIRIYGFAIQTQKDTIIELSKDQKVNYIYTKPVL